MHRALLQLHAHLRVGGHQLAVVAPVQVGDLVHQGGGAVEGQAVPPEDHLPLGGQQGEGVWLQGTVWVTQGRRKMRRRRRRRRSYV